MIAIDIVNYKTWEITLRCVESIREVCTLPYHIYIVDNQSPNDAYEQLKKAFGESADVTVISSGCNGGYGYGLNCGIKAAVEDGCDAVIASNNDIIYLSGAIEEMYSTLKSSREIAIAGAQQMRPEGKKQLSAIKRAYSKWELMLWYVPFRSKINLRRHKEDRSLQEAQERVEVAFPLGGCYMLDAEILQGENFFDNQVFMYAEENIVGEKVSRLNKKIVLCPGAKVIHQHSATTGRSNAQHHLIASSSLHYFCKYYAGMGRIALAIHRGMYYFLMSMKCLLLADYRKRMRTLFSVFSKEVFK